MYIGINKIESEKDGLVTFEDGTSRFYGKALSYVSTEEPLEDLNKLRDLHLDPVVAEILSILKAYNTNAWDTNYLNSLVMNTILNLQSAAIANAIGHKETEIPVSFIFDNIDTLDPK